MPSPFSDIAAGGSLPVALAVALLAGLVSFFAPCMLPLVPGYLSYVTGMAGSELPTASTKVSVAGALPPVTGPATTTTVHIRPMAGRSRTVAGATLFVAGFTAVFALLAYAAGAAGRVLLVHSRTIEVIAGILTVVLGLAFAGLIPVVRTWRIQRLPAAGLAGAPVLGATFALSWTPCLSPTLTVVLGLAAVEGSATRGVTLAVAYSLGMGLPFIGFAFGLTRLLRLAAFIRRHSMWVTRIGGILLVAVGLALITGVWGEFVNWLRAAVGPGQIGI